MTTRPLRPAVVLVGIMLIALNMRASLAVYPPLIVEIRRSLEISAGTAGLVSACAVLMMGVGSFPALRLAARVGRERAAAVAVVLLLAGCLVRAAPLLPTLVLGSLLVGLGIGLGGVLLTGLCKDYFPSRAGAVSGAYVSLMLIGATVASAVAVPVALAGVGWSGSLSAWSVPAALALAAWLPAAVKAGPPRPGSTVLLAPRLPWRDPFARLTAGYFSMSSLQFYGWLTWLAPYYEGLGWSEQQAALLLAVYSLGQIPFALAFPALAERGRWVTWSGISLAAGLTGTVGVLVAPELGGPVTVVWVVLIAGGVGAGFPLGLALIAWRTPDARASESVSSMCLGIGYLVAGVAPLVMGVLADLTGAFTAPLLVVLAAGVLQVALVVRLRGPGTRLAIAPGVVPAPTPAP